MVRPTSNAAFGVRSQVRPAVNFAPRGDHVVVSVLISVRVVPFVVTVSTLTVPFPSTFFVFSVPRSGVVFRVFVDVNCGRFTFKPELKRSLSFIIWYCKPAESTGLNSIVVVSVISFCLVVSTVVVLLSAGS